MFDFSLVDDEITETFAVETTTSSLPGQFII
jgi:hypothetical protein